MKRDSKKITLFNESGCLTHESLISYVFTNLENQNRIRIEGHIAKCELCKEAVEGIKLGNNQQSAEMSINRVNGRIQRKINEQRRDSSNVIKIKPVWYYAVASIVLIVAFFSYFNLKEQNIDKSNIRFLGDNLDQIDTTMCYDYIASMDYLFKTNEAGNKEEGKKIENKSETSIAKDTENEIEEIVYASIQTKKDKKLADKKGKYIIKNDMIIRDSKQPEPLTSLNAPFNVFVQKKIDSLLERPDLKYNITAEFIVSKEGMLKHPRILSSSNSKLDSYTVKALEESPGWKPATINSKPVDYPIRITIVKE